MDLGRIDERLLERIQQDMPLAPRPFSVLGKGIDLEESKVIAELKRLKRLGIIREVSAILNGWKIGYKSTLVAAAIAKENLEDVAAAVNKHPGVSHNYQRTHHYNLWFTLSIPQEHDFEHETDAILNAHGSIDYLMLDGVKKYKLRVQFYFSSTTPQSQPPTNNNGCRDPMPQPPVLAPGQKRIIEILQEDFPITTRPWDAIARTLVLSEQELLARVQELKAMGIIRRLSGSLQHRKVGFSANGMACFAIPLQRMDAAGNLAAQHPSVSHCYHRSTTSHWPYPLFVMIHATSREECNNTIKKIAAEIACTDYTVLYSSREFKKQRVKYR